MRRSTTSSASISAAISRRSPPSCALPMSCWWPVGCGHRRLANSSRWRRPSPAQLTMASAGVGTASHLAGELFKMTTGVEMVHVAYRGGAGAYDDLLGGRADVYFPPLISAREHVRSGALRALAVRLGAGLRGQHLVWHRRAQEHARRHRRAAQRRDQCGLGRSPSRGADRRWRRHGRSPARRPTSAS